MGHLELEFKGRLAIFCYTHRGQPTIIVSGYLIKEENQARLYLTSVSADKPRLPARLVHLAIARFARELQATHLVPVAHAQLHGNGDLARGFLPTLPQASLAQLEAKLARHAAASD